MALEKGKHARIGGTLFRWCDAKVVSVLGRTDGHWYSSASPDAEAAVRVYPSDAFGYEILVASSPAAFSVATEEELHKEVAELMRDFHHALVQKGRPAVFGGIQFGWRDAGVLRGRASILRAHWWYANDAGEEIRVYPPVGSQHQWTIDDGLNIGLEFRSSSSEVEEFMTLNPMKFAW